MKKYFIALAAMLILILDSKTAIAGGQEGVRLCQQTVIPALFPFFLVTHYLCGNLAGSGLIFLRPLEKLCRTPEGSGGLLISGFLGGYPVGAGSVYQAWKNGQLTRPQGQRMLGFLNNAGPAFIFGMGATLFTSPLIPWVIWLTHILCAVLTSTLLPGENQPLSCPVSSCNVTLMQSLKNTVKVLAQVCGWVVLFRMLLAFSFSFLDSNCSLVAKALLAGALELTNGTLQLQNIPQEWVRYLFFSLFINMGGLCVGMQTLSVVGELGIFMYWRGKTMQTLLGVGFSMLLLPLLFPSACPFSCKIYTAAVIMGITGFFWGKYLKNSWQFGKIGV